MKTLIVVFEGDGHDWLKLLFSPFTKARRDSSGRLFVEEQGDWLAISSDSTIATEYDGRELEIVTTTLKDPWFVLVEARGEELLCRMIMGIDISVRGLIDNDHGLILPIREVQNRIRNGVEWLRARS